MPIIYTEKGIGLHRAIAAAGHALWEEPTGWKSSNDQAVQVIIDAYNPLPDYKDTKIAAIKADGLARIQLVFPAINGFDELALVREMYLSIAAGARSPTANWQKMIDIYTAGNNAITTVKAATTKAQIDAVTPAWPA